MVTNKNKPADIDEYLATIPEAVRGLLQELRQTIKKAAPAAKETINYQIPTFVLHGNLVHFAAFSHHIGFYPGPSAVAAFEKELSAYEGAKGTVKFPFDRPLPLDLVSEIVRFRVKENMEKPGKKIKKIK